MSKKKATFSVALGLFDYINPIFYGITSIIIICNLDKLMNKPYNYIYILGVVISLIFGLTIPTVKLLVGLGKFEFKMPVNLVSYVNTGIIISGLMLLKSIFNISNLIILGLIALVALILYAIYHKTKKFNTIAVLIGAIGYMFIYVSLITLSIRLECIIPIAFYGIAICLYLLLIFIGIKANLKDAKIHWIIEISNVLCQLSVVIGTFLLFVVGWVFYE